MAGGTHRVLPSPGRADDADVTVGHPSYSIASRTGLCFARIRTISVRMMRPLPALLQQVLLCLIHTLAAANFSLLKPQNY